MRKVYSLLLVVFVFAGVANAQQRLCQGDMHEYYVENTEEDYVYHWQIEAENGNITELENNGSRISVKWNDEPKTTKLGVYATNAYGCNSNVALLDVELVKKIEIPHFIFPKNVVVDNQNIVQIPCGFVGDIEIEKEDKNVDYFIELENQDLFPKFYIDNNKSLIHIDDSDNHKYENLNLNLLAKPKQNNPCQGVSNRYTIVFVEKSFVLPEDEPTDIPNEQPIDVIPVEPFPDVVDESIKLTIPNIFTPNGDGVNDCFRVKYNVAPSFYRISIFSREGKCVYSSNNIDDVWRGLDCRHGVYFYVIDLISNGSSKKYSGHVTIASPK